MKSAEEIYVVSLLFSSSGVEIKNIKDPIKYIKENIETMLTEETFSYIRDNISVIPKESKIKSNEVIAFLVRDYISNYYSEDNFLIKYLANSTPDVVFAFFKENNHFSKELIESYFKNLGHEKQEIDEKAHSLMLKYELNIKVEFLASILRKAFNKFYTAVCTIPNLPCSSVQMFLMAIKGHAIIGGNKDIEESIEFLKSNYSYLIRLMYADVYEDLASNGLLVQQERKITQIVTKAINENNYVLPANEEDAKMLFAHFNYLADSKDKRRNNRRGLDKAQLEDLKKINPIWMLDESDITIKR